MKTIYLSILISAGMLFFTTGNISAQSDEQVVRKNPGFVDKDNDGICDHYDGKRIGKGLGEGGGLRALYGDEPQYRNRRYVEGDSTTYYRGRGQRFADGDTSYYRGRRFNENDTPYYRNRRPNNPNYRKGPNNNYRRGNRDFRRGQNGRRLRDGTGPDCPNPEIREENLEK